MITVIIALCTIVALYWYGTKNYKYWEERGVKHDKPVPFLGNNAKIFFMKKSLSEAFTEVYCRYSTEKVVGYYEAHRPLLIIRDPDIIKRVLTTDFMQFHERAVYASRKHIDPIQHNVFFTDGDTWRLLRQRMTPAFTSGKLKAMFPLIIERAEKLQSRILDAASDRRIMDARDMMSRFTIDFIGACGFGLEMETQSDENSPFKKLGRKIFNKPVKQILIAMLKLMFPEFLHFLKMRGDIEGDVYMLVNQILKSRNYQPAGRHDFIDLLLECQAKGTIVGESIENFKSDGTPERVELELDEKVIAAQVLLFFAAGFETSSSSTSYTLHELAFNPDKQKKVQEEIDRVLAKHNNKLSYEAIREMTYLECCFKEGLRMFPSVGYLTRQSVSKYTFPEIDLTIDKGTQVVVPVHAIQNDPQYFENPEQFRPERFLPEEYESNKKRVYLPFGTGPRSCIGERLGLMQSLAGLAAVLSCSSVEPAPTTVRHPEINPRSFIVQVLKTGLPLIFREREIPRSTP